MATKKINPDELLKNVFRNAGKAHAAKMKRRAERGPVPSLKFVLEEEEWETFNAWNEEHRKKCPLAKNASRLDRPGGGSLTYSFTHTGIGVAINVQCTCGAEVDCTDYGSW